MHDKNSHLKKRSSSDHTTKSLRKEAEKSLDAENLDVSKNSEPISLDQTQKLVHELQVHQIELQMQNEELRRAQTELTMLKERYLDLYDMAPMGYCILNEEGLILEANITASRLLETPRQTLTQQPLTRFILKADQDIYYLYKKRLLESDQHQSCELRMVSSKGLEFWVHLSGTTEKNSNGIHMTRQLLNDITERKAMEDKLKVQEELMFSQSRQAAMGEMIAMIAHQWRQPLSIIGMNINSLTVDMTFGKTITNTMLTEMNDEILNQVNHLSTTIDDFRDFFKPVKEKTFTSICVVMENTMAMTGTALKNSNIDVVLDLDCQHTVHILPNELLQVFLNILNNAKDALQAFKPDSPRIDITIKEEDGLAITTICDNGGGIPADILHKLGDPYVSSKAKNGTGLGLYMSKIITEKHLGGTLEWNNTDVGACFTLTFPLHESR